MPCRSTRLGLLLDELFIIPTLEFRNERTGRDEGIASTKSLSQRAFLWSPCSNPSVSLNIHLQIIDQARFTQPRSGQQD